MSTAVLLSCHGTAPRIEDVPEFVGNILRGRPTPPAVLDEVRRRLTLIGGSPLMRITAELAGLLEARLGIAVRVSARHFHPYIADVVAGLAREGFTTVISLPLAPQSVEVYHAEVRKAASTLPAISVRYAPPWGLEPRLVAAFTQAIDERLAGFDCAGPVPIVLSAHSLPRRVIEAGDRYEEQFRAMAAAVAAPFEARGHAVYVAFQSQGMSGGEWLGPDLATVFAQIAAGGMDSALISAIGFVADHVETLYDLDIELPTIASRCGVTRLVRAPSLNTRPAFLDALEAIARRLL